jgi:hypothetical protein
LKIKGHIDYCSAKRFDGWVCDLDDPQMRLRLAVHSGATLLGSCVADRFRDDLANEGLTDGRCAFGFELPDTLSTAELLALDISIVDSGHCFPFRVGLPVVGLTPGKFYERLAAEGRRSGRQWRRFKTCILHIGTEKTGSTSLQTFFGLNRTILADSGYFVPRSLTFPSDDLVLNHGQLAIISMNDEKFHDDLRRGFRIFDRNDLDQARRDLFTSFSEEVTAISCGCHTVILSSEQCHSRLVTSEEVQNLKDVLDYFCETYRIVVYLRPQHELAMSQYGMFLANGIYDIDMFPPLPPPRGYAKEIYTNRAYFDYRALLDRWSLVFGEDALYPRIYAVDALPGNDVVLDFTADFFLIGRGALVSPPRRNANMSARGQALLVSFYRSFGDVGRFGSGMLRERIRNAVLERFPGPGRTPTRPEVAAFLRQFAEDNEMIRSRWFPQRRHLFNVDLDRFPEVAATDVCSLEETMEMFVEVLLTDQGLRFSLPPEGLRRLQEGLPPSTE